MQNESPQAEIGIRGLRCGELALHLIDDSNLSQVDNLFRQHSESEYFLGELHRSCVPRFDEDGRRTKYGFYAMLAGELGGLCLLGISSWEHRRGYTGADTLPHMRGRNIAPLSKPLLFYLAFEILGLNRVETGCLMSNMSSRKSIEKTKGLQFEGTLRDYCRKADGQYEDELRYAILRRDWLEHYEKSVIEMMR